LHVSMTNWSIAKYNLTKIILALISKRSESGLGYRARFRTMIRIQMQTNLDRKTIDKFKVERCLLAQDLIICDVNADGAEELVVSLTDRVVRNYRW
jgi:hypothetical protein